MRSRLTLLVVSTFFLTMNVLLWRSEFAPAVRGTQIPPEVVWEKLVVSPDDSWLEIRHRGARIGQAHWLAKVNEVIPEGEALLEEEPPVGMIRRVTGYSLDFGGTVSLDAATKLRFDIGLTLDTNQLWRVLNIKFQIKPFSLEVAAESRKRELRLSIEDDGRKEYVYSFDDLRNPEKILRDLGGPLLPATLLALAGPLREFQQLNGSNGGLPITWEARQDKMQIGRADMRVYRLEAHLPGRYRAVLIISPVGEVLRIELPDELIMSSDAMSSL
jgi:hypothetical protein